jgi:hypothetical protein
VVLNSGGKKTTRKQAGAELCQAQVKLGLAMLDFLSSSSIYHEVIFHLQKTKLSSFYKKN